MGWVGDGVISPGQRLESGEVSRSVCWEVQGRLEREIGGLLRRAALAL